MLLVQPTHMPMFARGIWFQGALQHTSLPARGDDTRVTVEPAPVIEDRSSVGA
jgi:hypothetical protein